MLYRCCEIYFAFEELITADFVLFANIDKCLLINWHVISITNHIGIIMTTLWVNVSVLVFLFLNLLLMEFLVATFIKHCLVHFYIFNC
jgi:hypothetical protein